MPDHAPIIHFSTEEEQQAALDDFAHEMCRTKERRESVSPEELEQTLETIAG